MLKINNLKHTEWGISKILLEHSLDKIGREAEQIIRAINRTDLFRSILQETEAYKREIELYSVFYKTSSIFSIGLAKITLSPFSIIGRSIKSGCSTIKLIISACVYFLFLKS